MKTNKNKYNDIKFNIFYSNLLIFILNAGIYQRLRWKFTSFSHWILVTHGYIGSYVSALYGTVFRIMHNPEYWSVWYNVLKHLLPSGIIKTLSQQGFVFVVYK